MTISDREWQWLRRQYGDIAYEHPELHEQWIKSMPRPRLLVDNTTSKKIADYAGYGVRDGLSWDIRTASIRSAYASADVFSKSCLRVRLCP